MGSMQCEGWIALDERFDDLGMSGGSLERPEPRRLLSWCVEGYIDIIVVASLDRLARVSGADAARSPSNGRRAHPSFASFKRAQRRTDPGVPNRGFEVIDGAPPAARRDRPVG